MSIPSTSNLPLDRPTYIQVEVEKAFLKEAEKKIRFAVYEESDEHPLCGIDHMLLLEQRIKECSPSRRDFYILDIGSKDLSSAYKIARSLQKIKIPNRMHLHIISVRRETILGEKTIRTDKWTLHQLGAFHIEDIARELLQRDFSKGPFIDLIISRHTLRHLVDPTGTCMQIFHLLRSNGIFLFDGFRLRIDGETNRPNERYFSQKVVQMLQATEAPFLMMQSVKDDLGHFFLQRKRVENRKITLPYQKLHKSEQQNSTSYLVEFKKCEKIRQPQLNMLPWGINHFAGDRRLFNWIKETKIYDLKFHWSNFHNSEKNNRPRWQALFERQVKKPHKPPKAPDQMKNGCLIQ